jgi:xanthine dehydrogenase accessory factor
MDILLQRLDEPGDRQPMTRLAARLRSPMGLDLGAVTPEAIALSVVAEIQPAIAGRATISTASRKQA